MHLDDVQALVVLSFGGPEQMAEVVPFLQRVVAGRNVPPERLAAVAEQYRSFGGVSPLPQQNRDLVMRLRAEAPTSWRGERVYLANRNSAPFPHETFAELARVGVDTAAVFVTSAFSSYSGCRQYRENLADGLTRFGTALELRVLPRFPAHPILRSIWIDRLLAVADLHIATRVVFVTHSLPLSQVGSSVPGVTGYLAQHEALAAAVVAGVEQRLEGTLDWQLAFQSRSGPPSQPWLEPDISLAVDRAADDGCERVVVVPIGFCAENLEIRWDLDTVAAETAARRGLAFERLLAPQSDPRFGALVWDLFTAADGLPCEAACCPNPHGPRHAVGDRPAAVVPS